MWALSGSVSSVLDRKLSRVRIGDGFFHRVAVPSELIDTGLYVETASSKKA